MADHGSNSGGGEVVDRPEDVGGPMETETEDQQPAGFIEGISAVVTNDGNGGESQQQEVGVGYDRRVTEEAGAVGSSVEPVGPGNAVEGMPTVSGSSGGGDGSGAVGDDPGPNGSPPRDPARGKRAVVEGEETTEAPITYREEDMLFQPTATSLGHIPITKYDVAEHLPDEVLVKLLEDYPMISEIVLKAKEDRARAIVAAEVEERAEREQKEREELVRDAEAREKATAKAQWPRVTAVVEAGAVKQLDYLAEAYVPPTPHLFAPSGFAAYVPQRTEYDDEMVLRDPEAHIVNTWSELNDTESPLQVPNEWVNEAIHRMLALENVVRRAVSGLPLELRYPAPSPPRVQRAATQRPQGRAVSRSKRTRSPPQKKMAAKTPTLPVTTRWQTRSSQPAPASEEAARKAVARAELQYQIKMCERPAQEEGRAQKRPRMILPEVSEEEEDEGEEEEGEEDEEHSFACSDSDVNPRTTVWLCRATDPLSRDGVECSRDSMILLSCPFLTKSSFESTRGPVIPPNVLQAILKFAVEGVLA
ncbi:hypothetical protein RHMOL_Rhmol13G0168300 [Rhododendron molle]|uniref:Uncharacterized protein n=1 Tax=Rhododendron molle TaxID=49168 RepID=A0ACC0L8P2_RHOML|nr:hypothetical protein RHMOL_Rhmol13G0168300 [Rhododendron molle]